MSASGPQKSESSSTATQTSVQGAAGATSPTVTGGGNVAVSQVLNDPTLQLQTVEALTDVVNKALSGAGDIANQAQTNNAQQSSNDSQILAQALQSQAELATAQGTGGASLNYNTNNYLILGALALGGLAIVAFIFTRK